MSFVERFVILCPYLGESTIRGYTVHTGARSVFSPEIISSMLNMYIRTYVRMYMHEYTRYTYVHTHTYECNTNAYSFSFGYYY